MSNPNPNVPFFSQKQIDDWRVYEAVRRSNLYNMFTTQAIAATGLSKTEHLFCMEWYDALASAAASSTNQA